jgi:hypothetical protein
MMAVRDVPPNGTAVPVPATLPAYAPAHRAVDSACGAAPVGYPVAGGTGGVGDLA